MMLYGSLSLPLPETTKISSRTEAPFKAAIQLNSNPVKLVAATTCDSYCLLVNLNWRKFELIND